MQFLAMATTVIATATTTIVARCGCCGGTGGGSGGSGRSRRSCGSRCWARLVGIELRHLGCATDVFGSTITRLPTLPRLAVQRIFFQSALVPFAGRGRGGRSEEGRVGKGGCRTGRIRGG